MTQPSHDAGSEQDDIVLPKMCGNRSSAACKDLPKPFQFISSLTCTAKQGSSTTAGYRLPAGLKETHHWSPSPQGDSCPHLEERRRCQKRLPKYWLHSQPAPRKQTQPGVMTPPPLPEPRMLMDRGSAQGTTAGRSGQWW